MRIERVAIVGLGAMGTAYAGKFSRVIAKQDLQVIAPREKAERYRSCGVRLCGEELDLNIVEPADARPADLVIFTVKFYDLAGAVEAARGAVGDGTLVISLLNGITSEDVIADAYGREHVLLALAGGVDTVRDGTDTVVSAYGEIQFGEENNDPASPTPRVAAIGELFDRAGLKWQTPPDMRAALWRKLLVNVGANQTSAVLEAPYGVLQRCKEARGICEAAMREAAAVAMREGAAIDGTDVDRALARIDRISPNGKCSMLQDVEARRRTEADIFGGTISELGRKHGVPTPVNDMLLRVIKAKEEMFGL